MWRRTLRLCMRFFILLVAPFSHVFLSPFADMEFQSFWSGFYWGILSMMVLWVIIEGSEDIKIGDD